MLETLLEYEKSYRKEPTIEWMTEHTEFPIFAISIYLVIVFYVPSYFEKPIMVKPLLAAWNLGLALFSMIGVTRVVPVLIHNLVTEGYKHSICDNEWLQGRSGFWSMLFLFSKFFELFDTVYLVAHKREVIFLHWFHHVTVLLYCWHSYVLACANGLWFSAMNFSVHSVMYFYYFLMLFKPIRKYVKKTGPIITTIQISQMAMGLIVSISASWYVGSNPFGTGASPCNISPSNWKLGLAMYCCYFWLFITLFFDKYIKKKLTKNTVCNATDASGLFRGEKGGLAPEGKSELKKKSKNDHPKTE